MEDEKCTIVSTVYDVIVEKECILLMQIDMSTYSKSIRVSHRLTLFPPLDCASSR